MVNLGKDLLKKKKRNEAFIEDYRTNARTGNDVSDRFDAQYLAQDEEAAFAELPFDTPLIPSTLNRSECSVLALLYYEYSHGEIAERLEMTKREVAMVVREIRLKMADWKPDGSPPRSIPIPSTPKRAVISVEVREAA